MKPNRIIPLVTACAFTLTLNTCARADDIETLASRPEYRALVEKLSPDSRSRTRFLSTTPGASYYFSYLLEEAGLIENISGVLSGSVSSESPFLSYATDRYIDIDREKPKKSLDNIKESYAKAVPAGLASGEKLDKNLMYVMYILDFSEGNYKNIEKYGVNLAFLNDKNSLDKLNGMKAVSDVAVGKRDAYLALDSYMVREKPKQNIDFIIKNLIDNNLYGSLPSGRADLYAGLSLYFDGKRSESFGKFRVIPNSFFANTPEFFNIYANAAVAAGGRPFAMRKFAALNTSGYSRAALYAYNLTCGKLERKSDNTRSALNYFERAGTYTASTQEQDDVLWYRLASLYAGYRSQFLAELPDIASRWHNAAYFKDLLTELQNDLVSERKFDILYQTYVSSVRNWADPETKGSYAWTISRAIKHGFITDSIVRNSEKTALYINLMQESRSDPFSYEAFMSDALSGVAPEFLSAPAGRSIDPDASYLAALKESPYANLDAYVLGFYYFGLYKKGYMETRRLLKTLSPNTIRAAARTLAQNGYNLESINVLAIAYGRFGLAFDMEDLKTYYALPYLDLMKEASRAGNVDLNVLYGLIRQESGFNPTALSSANAVGLSQLMPATAQEFARKLGMSRYDLTNPADNLKIGASYIRWLKGRTQHTVGVLAGYNAGPTRVRRWELQFPDLPPELFVEVIPYAETRNYVKTIIMSACAYAYLYRNESASQTISAIFPGMRY